MAHSSGGNHRHYAGREGRLLFSIVFNLVIALVEVIGGLISGSLSLLSDSLHNLSDVFSLTLSLIAVRMSKKGRTEQSTFGYKRIEVLAALSNAAILIAVAFFLFREAVERILHPRPIDGKIMGVIALIGLIANIICVWLLKKDAEKSLNIRSSYLHLLADALSSVVVVAGAAAIYWFEIHWIDGFLAIGIALYVLKGGYDILKQSVHILMQGAPRHISIQDIRRDIEGVEGVADIHHLHLWSLSEEDIYLEAHINLRQDRRISETGKIKSLIQERLNMRYKINHVTLQFEYGGCSGDDLIKKQEVSS